MRKKEGLYLPDRHGQGLIPGVAVGTGGDQGEGHALAALGERQCKRIAVASGQQAFFVMRPAASDGTDGVDDPFRGKVEAGAQLGLACGTAAQPGAIVAQRGTGRTVDGTVYASAAQQAGICGINNAVTI